MLQVGVVFLSHFGQLFIYFLIRRDDGDLLLLLDPAKLLNLQALIDEAAQGFPLELRQVLLGGLDPGGRDQQAHPLGQVEGRYDLVIHHRCGGFRKTRRCDLEGGRSRRIRRGPGLPDGGAGEGCKPEAGGGEGLAHLLRGAVHHRNIILQVHDLVRLPSDTAVNFTPEARH